MSTYEWERGTVKIPAGEVAKVKKAIRDAYNKEKREAYEVAVRLYEMLKGVKPSLRGEAWEDKGRSACRHMADDAKWRVEKALFGQQVGWGSVPKLKCPGMKDFPQATTRTTRFALDTDTQIVFDGNVLHWDVRENNHAVDYAWQSPVAIAMDRALKRVKWTSRTGGHFESQDEYAEDAGVGSHITHTYGKAPVAKVTRYVYR